MMRLKKDGLVGSFIGLLITYVLLGVMLHLIFRYDLLRTVKILTSVTLFMGAFAILVTVVVWLIFFVISKRKR